MAGKITSENGKAELIRMALNHEQLAQSLEGAAISDVQPRPGAG